MYDTKTYDCHACNNTGTTTVIIDGEDVARACRCFRGSIVKMTRHTTEELKYPLDLELSEMESLIYHALKNRSNPIKIIDELTSDKNNIRLHKQISGNKEK